MTKIKNSLDGLSAFDMYKEKNQWTERWDRKKSPELSE